MVFGRINVEQPTYVVVQTTADYEVRTYEPRVMAECRTRSTEKGNNDAFRVLAKYIGVFGEPENNGTKIAMTAPVITQSSRAAQPISMTAPVLTSGTSQSEDMSMSFVLPAAFTKENAPTPNNPRVTLREMPRRTVACVTFSGRVDNESCRANVEKLYAALLRDGVSVMAPASDAECRRSATAVNGVRPAEPVQPAKENAGINGIEWSLARFNPPFTIPFLRTNEIYVRVADM